MSRSLHNTNSHVNEPMNQEKTQAKRRRSRHQTNGITPPGGGPAFVSPEGQILVSLDSVELAAPYSVEEKEEKDEKPMLPGVNKKG
jgi:hypothetical protein